MLSTTAPSSPAAASPSRSPRSGARAAARSVSSPAVAEKAGAAKAADKAVKPLNIVFVSTEGACPWGMLEAARGRGTGARLNALRAVSSRAAARVRGRRVGARLRARIERA